MVLGKCTKIQNPEESRIILHNAHNPGIIRKIRRFHLMYSTWFLLHKSSATILLKDDAIGGKKHTKISSSLIFFCI